MIKDLYLFTNGMVVAFDENKQQKPELQGKLTDELKQRIIAEMGEGIRITFARWKKGFFELTKDEFMAAEIQGGERPGEFADGEVLVLRFSTAGTVEGNETNSSSGR
jgi:hypothetical protein